MGERIGASIQFGGVLSRDNAELLIELIKGEGLTLDFDETNGPTLENLSGVFGDWQVNYGMLEELTSFGVEHGLAFRHWFDGGGDWMAATNYHDLEGRDEELVGSEAQGFYLSENQIEGGRERLAWMKSPMPALEIVA